MIYRRHQVEQIVNDALAIVKSDIDRTFESKDKALSDQRDLIDQLTKQLQSIEETIVTRMTDLVEQRVSAKIRTVEEQRESRLNGSTPYFEVISELDVNDNGRTKIELDWNQAFIKELRSKGYTGTNEEEIIHKWMRVLADQVERGYGE